MADLVEWMKAHGFELTAWQVDILRHLYAESDKG